MFIYVVVDGPQMMATYNRTAFPWAPQTTKGAFHRLRTLTWEGPWSFSFSTSLPVQTETKAQGEGLCFQKRWRGILERMFTMNLGKIVFCQHVGSIGERRVKTSRYPKTGSRQQDITGGGQRPGLNSTLFSWYSWHDKGGTCLMWAWDRRPGGLP